MPLGATDAALAAVVAAWADLPLALKTGILAMVRVATGIAARVADVKGR